MLADLYTMLEPKDYLYVGGGLSLLYLLNGVPSHAFCEIVLGAVPAAFTYKVLLDTEINQEGQEALMFFWVLHGVFVAAGHLIATTPSFYILKFALLGFFLFKAITKNDQILANIRESWGWRSKRSAIGTSRFADTTECTQMHTNHRREKPMPLYDESMLSTAREAMKSRIEGTPRTFKASSVRLQTTTYHSIENQGFRAVGTPFIRGEEKLDASPNLFTPETRSADSTLKQDLTEENTNALLGITTALEDSRANDAAHHPSFDTLTSHAAASGDSTRQTIPLGRGEVHTCPCNLITFDDTTVGTNTSVTLVNTTNERIMWALKTNAHDRLQASPNCGVMTSGTAVAIVLAIAEDCKHMADGAHRVAIDYAFVGGTIQAFEKEMFVAMPRHRHLMKINYLRNAD
ncbi:unnamed protein product, partial [Mesorhabditis spiculigera]